MINKKLLQFQQQGITLVKDGTNPHFHSSYPTLNEVLDKVKEPLNKLGVLIIQESTPEGLKTRLVDTEDDTFVESIMPYTETSTAQKLGSNITYLRRYSLVALLGLGDEDDDGNAASTPRPSPSQTRQNAPGRTQTPSRVPDIPIVNLDDPIADSLGLVPHCNHNLPAKRLQTKKPGANFGRFFYGCPKPMSESCGFFQWEESGDDKTDIEGTREDYDRKTGQMLPPKAQNMDVNQFNYGTGKTEYNEDPREIPIIEWNQSKSSQRSARSKPRLTD